jgi:hypothetical protein
MMQRGLLFGVLLSALCSIHAIANDGGFEARQRRLLEVVSREPDVSIYGLAARLALHRDIPATVSAFDSTMEAYHGYTLISTYLRSRSILPDALQRKVREAFRSRGLYRGDTENHWVMYYTGMYLAAQTWPNEDGGQWFNGRSSDENFHEAEGWLNHWMTLATTIGQGEFDSPTYMPAFLAPMLALYDFAADPAMKTKAQMMCDLLLADFAVENLRGNYGGGHSRDYPPDIINPLGAQTTRISWLYFGEPDRETWEEANFLPRVRSSWESVLGALSTYRMPDIIRLMATDRSVPYVHREHKRVRNVIRFGDELNPPAYKYTYMTEDYVLGSLHGGVLEPFQQHTWDVTFVSDKPNNTIFTMHPYYSSRQLGMFFPEELKVLAQDVDRYKIVYTSPDKWNSSSPYEQTFQNKNVLIVLYNIVTGATHPHIDGFFPKTLDARSVDSTGWIFCRGGKTAIAFYPLRPYVWIDEEKDWRLRSSELKNGVIVEVASMHSIADYEKFVDRMRRQRVLARDFDRSLTVSYTSLDGDALTFTYDGARRLNGATVDLTKTKLYDGPFMSAELGSGIIQLRYGNQVRVLDFQKGKITEQ